MKKLSVDELQKIETDLFKPSIEVEPTNISTEKEKETEKPIDKSKVDILKPSRETQGEGNAWSMASG